MSVVVLPHAPRVRSLGDLPFAVARLYLDGWAELPNYNGRGKTSILAYKSPVPQDVVALFSAPNGGFQIVVLQPIVTHYQRPIPEDPAVVLAPVGTVITPGNIAAYFGHDAHVDFASSAPPVSQGGVATPVAIPAEAPPGQRAVPLTAASTSHVALPSQNQGLRAALFEQIVPQLTAPQQAELARLVKGWTDAGVSYVAAESLYLPNAQAYQRQNQLRLTARPLSPGLPARPVRYFGE